MWGVLLLLLSQQPRGAHVNKKNYLLRQLTAVLLLISVKLSSWVRVVVLVVGLGLCVSDWMACLPNQSTRCPRLGGCGGFLLLLLLLRVSSSSSPPACSGWGMCVNGGWASACACMDAFDDGGANLNLSRRSLRLVPTPPTRGGRARRHHRGLRDLLL